MVLFLPLATFSLHLSIFCPSLFCYILSLPLSLSLSSFSVDSDHMQHIAAVIREILVHSKDIFDLKQHLPSLPDISTSPNFRHEFIEYASKLEWVTFHKNVVRREEGREGGRERGREREREGGREKDILHVHVQWMAMKSRLEI